MPDEPLDAHDEIVAHLVTLQATATVLASVVARLTAQPEATSTLLRDAIVRGIEDGTLKIGTGNADAIRRRAVEAAETMLAGLTDPARR